VLATSNNLSASSSDVEIYAFDQNRRVMTGETNRSPFTILLMNVWILEIGCMLPRSHIYKELTKIVNYLNSMKNIKINGCRKK